MSIQQTTQVTSGAMVGSLDRSKLDTFKSDFKSTLQRMNVSPLKVLKNQPFGSAVSRTLGDQIHTDLSTPPAR